jgi:glycosyltransferase involved in cell wall biosynthesis
MKGAPFMSVPRVSCLCPTFGRSAVLGEAIDCFLRQDYPNKELLICNDSPIPITRIVDYADRLKDYGTNVTTCDEDISDAFRDRLWYRQNPETGWDFSRQSGTDILIYNYKTRFETLGAKRNELLALANGDWCAQWDDDDIFMPWHLSANLGMWSAEQLLQINVIKQPNAWVMYAKDPVGWDFKGYWPNVYESNMIFRREHALSVGGYVNESKLDAFKLLEEFKLLPGYQEVNLNPLHSYCFRWNTNFGHIELLDTDDWAETNVNHSDVIKIADTRPIVRQIASCAARGNGHISCTQEETAVLRAVVQSYE